MSASFSHFYNPKYQRKNDEAFPNVDVSSQAHRNVWLIKVPKFISEQWKNTADGSFLGKMTVKENIPTSRSSINMSNNITSSSGSGSSGFVGRQVEPPLEISLQLPDLPETQSLPKQFNLTLINSKVSNTFVFSDTKKGYADSIEGKIEHQGVMVPKINSEYHKMNKHRTQKAATHKKQTKFVEKDELARKLGLGFAVSSQDSIFAQKYIKQKSQDTRKERIPQAQLIQKMIHLFREYPYWSLKGLTERTHQPQVYVKEILPSVARLNKRGPYAGMYSLLPELKQSDTTSDITPTSADPTPMDTEMN